MCDGVFLILTGIGRLGDGEQRRHLDNSHIQRAECVLKIVTLHKDDPVAVHFNKWLDEGQVISGIASSQEDLFAVAVIVVQPKRLGI